MEYKVTSPSGKIEVILGLTPTGQPTYRVLAGGEVFIRDSALGLVTPTEDMSSGLTIVGHDTQSIDEQYTVPSRKKAVYVNRAEELSVCYTRGEAQLTITARAYDDAFALRYTLFGKHADTMQREATAFDLTGAQRIWYMPYQHCYEGHFQQNDFPINAKDVSIPALIQKDGKFILLSEAALNGGYCGLMLAATGGLFTASFTPHQKTLPHIAQEFVSPWRFGVIGDLADIYENNVTENLAAPCDTSVDYSFVQTGSASWSWLTAAYHGQRNPEDLRRHIDLAAKMKWKYFIIDHGWQHQNYILRGKRGSMIGHFKWLPDFLAYARERGVGVLAWTHCDNLRTPAMRARLTEWKKLGFVGIKVDFFDSESQSRMQLYDDIYRECARLGLIVNAHGANKPTGEVRTYPHVITREGIRGEEYQQLESLQYAIIPFTRAAVGPADVTERPHSKNGTVSEGFQAAVSFAVASGLHCMGGSPEEYAKPAPRDLYFDFPEVYDDTKLLDGYPAEHIVLMRRAADTYYVAGLTVAARDVTIHTEYLAEGEYRATLFACDKARALVATESTLRAGDTLDVHLATEDGFVLRLVPIAR